MKKGGQDSKVGQKARAIVLKMCARIEVGKSSGPRQKIVVVGFREVQFKGAFENSVPASLRLQKEVASCS